MFLFSVCWLAIASTQAQKPQLCLSASAGATRGWVDNENQNTYPFLPFATGVDLPWSVHDGTNDSDRSVAVAKVGAKTPLYSLTEFNLAVVIRQQSSNDYLSPYLSLSGGISSVVGMKVAHRLHLGIGAGADYTSTLLFFPVFADLRLLTGRGKDSPFVGIAGGYAFAVPNARSYFRDHCYGGFYFNPMVGGRFQLSLKTALHVGIGLRIQESRFRHDGWSRFGPEYALRFTAVNLRTGLEF